MMRVKLTKEQRQHCDALVEALYKNPPKTEFKLRDATTRAMCCLGVACDLYNSSLWAIVKVWDLGWSFSSSTEVNHFQTPPAEVCEYYGFTNETGFEIPNRIVNKVINPTLTRLNNTGYISMMSLNDGYSDSHYKTAQILEEYLNTCTEVVESES